MRPWHLGNTSVRSPFRLRDGLAALSASPLQGHLRGKEQEIAFRNLLGQHGIVQLGNDDTYSVGRKWRAALTQLGFLFPEVPRGAGITQAKLGPVDAITPNGWRLIQAESVAAMQECFLRALAAYRIPSVLEKNYPFAPFAPLRHTLAVLLELESKTGESRLSFLEMSLVVQLSSTDQPLELTVEQVLDFRNRREAAPRKRQFDRDALEAAAVQHHYQAQTFRDYGDTNFRYLKATGLVQSKGNGLKLVPEKRFFIERLVREHSAPTDAGDYLLTLCNGAALPTDQKDGAVAVLDDLLAQLNRRGFVYDLTGKRLEQAADIAIVRHEIEDQLARLKEADYAAQQAREWREIAGYMDLLARRRRSRTLTNGETMEIPPSEAPAYLEWVLWRAFLAINSLENPPHEARRFKIDQDFLPVGTAPGNGPDLIFEFAEFVVVVEVTLTESSRQEAAEGEPVRRHVAHLVQQYAASSTKKVYGLFVANRIDSNTAETFRIGVWYWSDDLKMRLDIVPVALEQFKAFFEALFATPAPGPSAIRDLLDRCSELRARYEAPDWKREIARVIEEQISQMAAAKTRLRG